MRILLVGEAPARGTTRPFEGRSGKFLAELLGPARWCSLLKMNLYKRPQPKQGKGSRFPRTATRRAKEFRLAGDELVLLAGKRVAAAFGVKARYFEPCLLRGRPCYVIPHPSGVNRWWNSELNHMRARNFFDAIWMALEGVTLRDGSIDEHEFRMLADIAARHAGRVFK